jgi:hypothetical protein
MINRVSFIPVVPKVPDDLHSIKGAIFKRVRDGELYMLVMTGHFFLVSLRDGHYFSDQQSTRSYLTNGDFKRVQGIVEIVSD